MNVFYAADGRLRAGWRFLFSLLVIIAAYPAAGLLAALLTGGVSVHALDALFRPLLLVLVAGGFAVLLINADGVRTRLLAAMGLGRRQAWADAGLGIAIGVGMIGFAVAVVAALGDLSLQIVLSSQTLLLALLQFWILGTGAMAEEVMFRGYPFQRLVEAVGVVFAIVLLSVLFAALHLRNPHASLWSWGFLNTAAVGVVFAVAYLRTRALWLPWGIHFGWNAAMGVGFGLPVSGLRQFSVVVQGEAEGPGWLTGGAYGLEDSATGAVAILVGLAAVLYCTRRHPARPVRGSAGAHLPEAYAPFAGPPGIQTQETDAPPAS